MNEASFPLISVSNSKVPVVFFSHWPPLAHSSNAENRINGLTVVPTSSWNGIYNGFANASYWPRQCVIWWIGEESSKLHVRGMWQFVLIISKSLTSLPLLFAVIRAKVVGKKVLGDGHFGTMRYTVKQMKVRASVLCWSAAEQETDSFTLKRNSRIFWQKHSIFFCQVVDEKVPSSCLWAKYEVRDSTVSLA